MVFGQISDILYYEVLDITLSKLQGLKSFKVTFHHAMKDEVKIVRLSTKFNVFSWDISMVVNHSMIVDPCSHW